MHTIRYRKPNMTNLRGKKVEQFLLKSEEWKLNRWMIFAEMLMRA